MLTFSILNFGFFMDFHRENDHFKLNIKCVKIFALRKYTKYLKLWQILPDGFKYLDFYLSSISILMLSFSSLRLKS